MYRAGRLRHVAKLLTLVFNMNRIRYETPVMNLVLLPLI